MRKYLKIIYVLLLTEIFALERIQGGTVKERIWNGQTVSKIEEVPFIALLKFSNAAGKLFQCGGSLISSRYVLTAGHCCFDNEKVEVRLGTLNRYEGGTEMTVTKEGIITNEDYFPGFFFNDTCLLKLPKEVITTDQIKPVVLGSEDMKYQDEYENQTAVIYGWGQRNSSDMTLPNDLQKTTNKIISLKDCMKQWPFVDSRQICTEKITTGSCPGDSGGPLMLNGTLIGLVSYGAACSNEEDDVYSYVPAFRNWIKMNSDV